MSLSNFLVYNEAVGGGGGSSSGNTFFYFHGTEEEMLAKYPVDEYMSALVGDARLVRVSDVGYSAEELNGTIGIVSGDNQLPEIVSNVVFMQFTNYGDRYMAVEEDGLAILMIASSGDMILLSLKEDVNVPNGDETIILKKGTYFNLSWFMGEHLNNGARPAQHLFLLIGAE